MTDVIQPEALAAIIDKEPPHSLVPYWFATKQGWVQNVPTLFGIAHVKTDKWPVGLPDIETSFVLNEERVPRFIFTQALDFFRKVFAAHRTEATTYICRDPNGQYSLFIPEQHVTGASVSHKVEPGQMGDRLPVGTIHSHCDFGAFHSGTDQHDMGKMPGVHATIGYVTREIPEVAIAIAVGQSRWTVEAEQIIDETILLDRNGYDTAPDSWLGWVHANTQAPWNAKAIVTSYGKPIVTFPPKTGYRLPSGYGNWETDWLQWREETDWKLPTPKDQPIELLIEECENELVNISIDLAEAGHRLQYTITHDPKVAKEWLDSLDLDLTKNARLWE
jgi:hypothetical protein